MFTFPFVRFCATNTRYNVGLTLPLFVPLHKETQRLRVVFLLPQPRMARILIQLSKFFHLAEGSLTTSQANKCREGGNQSWMTLLPGNTSFR